MADSFDVIIIGTGAIGSAVAAYLAGKGQKVLAIDRFTPPHQLGSSHGLSRIIREAYFEDPKYVPIIQRAYENWERLEKETGEELYVRTGGLMIGAPNSQLVKGALASAEMHRLPHQILNSKELRQRYPAFHPTETTIAVWEPRAGILFPEKCIAAHLKIAARYGASFQFNETICKWSADHNEVVVTGTKGTYHGSRLLICAGAWLDQLIPELKMDLKIERQVLYWFGAKSNPSSFQKENFPIYIWSYENDSVFYGFPDLGDGIKFARHYEGEITSADGINRNVSEKEIDFMRGLIRKYIPDADGPLHSTAVCMYTNTPNLHFWVNRHPQSNQVLIASICSGHGFKFASAFGEILGDILMDKTISFDLSLFGFTQ